ncbi:unnamed protein product [Anisakis simplex]|uniref:MADF domain-containing protein n=1 Tax=Anisakis simplex TaxID=6269 RepID=A0A0M3J7L5_ANISI|nr:unnamed protein product [Anisakis simplex]
MVEKESTQSAQTTANDPEWSSASNASTPVASNQQQHHQQVTHHDPVETPHQKQLLNLVFRSMKRTHDFFFHDYHNAYPTDPKADELWRSVKVKCEFGDVLNHVQDEKRRKEDEILNLPKNETNGGSVLLSTPSNQNGF